MTIETDRDKLRVVSLTKFNQSTGGFCLGPVEERRCRLTKRPTQGKLGAVFLDGPFFMLSFFHALFCITLVQILRLQSDSLGQYG